MASNRVEAEILQKKRFTKVLMSIAFSTVCLTWPNFAAIVSSALTRKTAYQISLESHILYILGKVFDFVAKVRMKISQFRSVTRIGYS
ncbi:hypothetical protein TrispH2_006953 [Trichoplax sp. H2]|nr:hypothetical protein TrispH2_006953 [Trichoplax sp. H2]|eukprot:RDD41873.1 hypothetical protein TrispH2_006953 [Trichoplax sp. H2]